MNLDQCVNYINWCESLKLCNAQTLRMDCRRHLVGVFFSTTNYSKQRISICHKNSFSKRSWRLISRPWLEFSWQQLCNVFCVPARLSKSEKTTLMRSWAKTYLRFNLLSQIMFIFIVHSTIINQTGVLLLLFEACVTNWREVLNYSSTPVLVVLQQGTSTGVYRMCCFCKFCIL